MRAVAYLAAAFWFWMFSHTMMGQFFNGKGGFPLGTCVFVFLPATVAFAAAGIVAARLMKLGPESDAHRHPTKADR